MSYRDKIEKYKKHQLSETEMKEVEGEIEKSEAISDYLADRLMDDFSEEFFKEDEGKNVNFNDETGEKEDSAKEFEVYVRKSIRRSFTRMGMAVGGIVLAAVLFFQFGMSPLVSAFYYNPSKREEVTTEENGETYSTSYSQIEMDYYIYANLTLPCRSTDTVYAVPMGYGNYQVVWSPTIGYGMQKRASGAGQIRKGELELYSPDYLKYAPGNYFASYGLDRARDFRTQLKENVIEEDDGTLTIYNRWYYSTLEDMEDDIKNLDENAVYQAYVTFDSPKSYTEVRRILEEIKENEIGMAQPWIAVYDSEEGDNTLIGFDYETYQGMIPAQLNKEYPNLTMFEQNDFSDEVYEEATEKMQDETEVTQHLVSMLRYMADQKQFTDMMLDFSNYDTLNWKNTADYIEDNGISSFGFVCIAQKEDIQKMLQMDEIISIVPESWG